MALVTAFASYPMAQAEGSKIITIITQKISQVFHYILEF